MKVYIVMGVSGVGKTTIGKQLAGRLQLPFYDADDFHPRENVEKMMKGFSLDDNDRRVWLKRLSENIEEWANSGGAILACSALKEKYREQLQGKTEADISWIFLYSDYEVIMKRLSGRKDHYFKPDLLMSQFRTLEVPGYGIRVDVNKSIEEITSEIMGKIKNKDQKSEIGLLGLGVMGKSLALNLATKGIKVAVYNRQVAEFEVDIARNFADEFREVYEFPWFDELEAFVRSLERPRNILLMVNAGKVVDIVIDSLLPFLEKDDLIIDGGNSHYKDTVRREKSLKEKGVLFMGAGISGGEEGARKGPSIMPGGSREAYERAGTLLEKIAAKDKKNQPCCTYIGPDGAGHFVKMLHNGIEYGEMQLIAEIYQYLRFSTRSEPEEIADLFEYWNKQMRSYLLEISVDILRKREEGGFLIDKILDAAKQKGTGGWSTNAALELGVPFDTITAAVLARNISGKKEERMAAEKIYQNERSEILKLKEISDQIFEAYKTATIINHAIGFDLLITASEEYQWDLDLSEIARVWTNGCIIRSGFMEELVALLKERPDKNILMHPEIVERIKGGKPRLTEVLAQSLKDGFPMPVMSAASNYLLSFISGQSSANMIQAQRDYFGAHTYERKDRERGVFFHTDWESSGE